MIFIGAMGPSSLSRASTRTALGLLIGGASLLPGACGGKADVVFVGSSGGSDGSGGAEGGQGGMGGMGGAGTGGANTGGTTGGTGGGNTGGSGGTISATCGNSETESGEACDSGGQDASNCDFDCTDAECGDGYTNEEARETCDDDGESAECDDDCTVPECGDGVLNESAGEQCEDDNEDRGDGCSPDCEREILILGDGISDDSAADLLRAAGFAVAVSPALEYEYDGTNPPPDEFCGIIAFDSAYAAPMTFAGQDALTAYVDDGGSFLSTGWTATEFESWGGLEYLDELILLDSDLADVSELYSVTPEGTTHPITANLPATFNQNAWGERGVCRNGAIPLILDGSASAVCVSDDESRRVISVGSAFGYNGYTPLDGYAMATFFVNAANWLCETDHELVLPAMVPGSTDVTSRFGYQAQCLAWEGDVCLQPYIAMASGDIAGPIPHCIDDLTTMRPVWGYQLEDTAATWCWIATGRSDVVSSGYAASYFNASGWMYAFDAAEDCVTGPVRHLSTVNVPTVGPQVWSFDDFSWAREGNFMNVACDWGEAP